MAARDRFFPALLEMVQRLEGVDLSATLGQQAVLPSKLTFESSFLVRTIPDLHLDPQENFESVVDFLNAAICWVWVTRKEDNEPIIGKELTSFLEDSESQLTEVRVQIANRFVRVTFVGDKYDLNKLIAVSAWRWETQPFRDRSAITIAIDFTTDDLSNEITNPREFLLRIAEAQSTTQKTENLFNRVNNLQERLNKLLNPQERYLWDQYNWLNDPSSKRKVAYELGDDPGMILLTDEEIPPEFQTPETRFKILDAKKQLIWKISRFIHQSDAIRLSELRIRRLGIWPPPGIPRRGRLESCENTSPNWLKQRTLQELNTMRYGEWQKLLQTLIAPSDLPSFIPEEVIFLDPRIQRGTHDSGDQARAVEMALSTPDCVLIQGPPGTGKTTVICEIIRQAIQRGERVLMVAPTHIAVDNVLEQVGSAEGVVAIRLGLPSKVGSAVERYTLEERAKSLFDQIRTELAQIHGTQVSFPKETLQEEDPLYTIQREWFEYLCQRSNKVGEHDPIQKLLLLNANLICATTIGIGSFQELPLAPVFDLLIIDEASKANLVDFLVPALHAKRWIIVGDHLQLSPFIDQEEVIAILASRLFATGHFLRKPKEFWDLKREDRKPFLERANEIFWRYQQIFEERMGNQDRQQHYWQELEEKFGVTAWIKQTLEEIRQAALISCFEYFQNLFEKTPKETGRFIKLRCQHRMNPYIANFLKEEIYTDYFSSKRAKEYTITIESDVFTFRKPLTLINTSSRPFYQRKEKLRRSAKGRYYNPLEASLIVSGLLIIRDWVQKHPESPIKTIGVITFYREQAKEIQNYLNRTQEVQRKTRYLYQLRDTPTEVEVSVVDRFQGREKDLIILSFTRSNKERNPGFIRNLNRLNVAISRARYMVMMIGDTSTLSQISRQREARNPLLTALIRHIRKNDGVIDILRVPDRFLDKAEQFKPRKRYKRKWRSR